MDDRDIADKIDEGLAHAHELVEEFKEAWSKGHLVDAGGLQVKMMSYRQEAQRSDFCELRFVLGGQLHTATARADDDEQALAYDSTDLMMLQRAVEAATGKFRIALTDAVFSAATRGELTG